MTDIEQSAPTPVQKNKIWHWARIALLAVLGLLLMLIIAIVTLASSDKGSRWLLEMVMNRQQMIHYDYEQGNLVQGIELKNIGVNVATTEVKIDRAKVRLGWRAILNKEVHLMTAQIGEVQVISHAPPTNEPFKFTPVKLPFVLRLDDANLQKLVIKSSTSAINFYKIQLNDAVWSDHKIEFENSALAMDFLSVNKATGHIELDKKYPLDLKAHVILPALENLNVRDIAVVAKGDLDTLKVGVASALPSLVSGNAVLHPVREFVPMRAKLYWSELDIPVAPEQELHSNLGAINLSGDLRQLNINADLDLIGKNIPQGQYQAQLNTDLNQLNITQFIGHLMQGELNLRGNLNWQDGLKWDVYGRMQDINPKDKQIPEAVQGFLPQDMSGQISSKGTLSSDQANAILATVDFDKYERWDVKLQQDPKDKPWQVNVAWHDINRAFPYIGWLKSQQGDVDVVLDKSGQDIRLATAIAAHEQSALPTGTYAAQVNFSEQILNVKRFSLTQAKGVLSGQALVHLPTEKQNLKWNAQLFAKAFNPQTISTAAPINRLDGQLTIQGHQDKNKYLTQLKNIHLTGDLPQAQGAMQTVTLTGNSTAAAIMHTGQKQGLQSFALKYNGALNAKGYTDGPLRLHISGTPQLIRIEDVYHQGVAGKIDAKGTVSLVQGIAWDMQALVEQFKPQYFAANVQGNITGRVKTTGRWSEQQKSINIQDLNLNGQINNKPLLGQGSLALSFTDDSGLMPKQFQANQLLLSYAKNLLEASGNAQRLDLKIQAANLSELHPQLRGTVKGVMSLQAQPKFNVKSNLVMQNFAFADTASIEKMSLIGSLPTEKQAAQMTLQLNNLKSGEQRIDSAQLELIGTLRAHLLKMQTKSKFTQFYVQLAGGFNGKNDWLGQLQQGAFDANRVAIKQEKPAAIYFQQNKKQLTVGEHCWSSRYVASSQICLDKPMVVSQAQGFIAASLKNIELGDFAAYMPAGVALSGKLNGHSRISWLQGQPMHMDTQLITREGQIGVSSEDLTEQPTASLAYKEIRVDAKTLPQGLSLRLNADTPLLGKGLVNILVGTQDKNKTLSGDVTLDKVKLGLFKPFVSDIRSLDGELSAVGKLAGTLQQPLFNGEVRLKNGKLAMISVPLQLDNIQLASSIRGSQASILGGFNAGRGAGRIEGNANWANAPSLTLKVSGTDLQVAQPPMLSAAVSPNIDIDIRPNDKRLIVKGRVDVPSAIISMPESSPNVINTSADVRIVETGKDQLALLKAAKPWNIRADIMVSLGQSVVFRGFNSVIPLVGRINLTQRGTTMAMQAGGAIGVSRQVKIEAYGQNLDLNRAIARFAGDLSNPSLDIDATKNVQNSTVGIAVSGVATRPNIRIYNDAGLTEQEALNALLTGRISTGGGSGVNNTEGFKSDVNNTIAAAGISMGLGGTRALTNQIGRSFGLSGLALDAQGSGDDTQVSVTGYITPDLYLRYGVGIFTPVNKLTMRYQVNRRLYLEASSSLERAVDIFYNWRF